MRSLLITTLLLSGFVLQTAGAAQVNVTASVTILEPVKVSMELPVSEVSSKKSHQGNSINDIAFNASQDYHYTVSLNAQDTCSHIDDDSRTITNSCSTATVNFN